MLEDIACYDRGLAIIVLYDTCGRRDLSPQYLAEGGFAGSIGSGDRIGLPALDSESEISEDPVPVKSFAQIIGNEFHSNESVDVVKPFITPRSESRMKLTM